MSFILEALKKSENERQRKIGPSLTDVQSRQTRNDRPWWAIAVGALLLVNLTVLAIVLLGNDDTAPRRATAQETTAPPAPTREPVPNTSAAAAPPARPVQRAATTSSSPSVRSLADEANYDGRPATFPDAYPNLAAAANVPERPSIVRPIEAPSVAPAQVQPAYAPQEPEFAEVLPTARDLAASGTNLPEMHLDIHVHSPNPSERFIFVNMRKYVEGQALSEGPTVERITAQGVVLNQAGLRFLLPRQ